MNLFSRHGLFILVLIFSLAGFNCALAADTNPPPRLTVELRDGSRIVGTSVEKNFKFYSELLGDLKLAVREIRSVEFTSTNSTKLTMVNGDVLKVSFVGSEFGVKTSFGKVELPVDSVRGLMMSANAGLNSHPAGLVALWSGENNGKDSVGGNDAIVPAGITYSPSKTGLGFNFDGTANRVIVPNAPALNFGAGQDFSIEGWIQPDADASRLTDDIMSFIDKRNALNRVQCQGYEFNLWHGRVHCRLSDSIAGNGGDWGSAGPDLRDGRMHQVALTVARNSTDGGKMYVDGQIVSTFDPTGVSGDLSTDQPLRIGNHADPNYRCFFKGMIGEVAIFNRALSPAEINEEYEAGDRN